GDGAGEHAARDRIRRALERHAARVVDALGAVAVVTERGVGDPRAAERVVERDASRVGRRHLVPCRCRRAKTGLPPQSKALEVSEVAVFTEEYVQTEVFS